MKKRILIADDEAGVRGLMRESLKPDYEVFEAADGSKTMRMMESVPVDLVVLDVCMPEMDGIETIRALRGLRNDVKILAVSGAFDGFFLAAARALGADAVLEKPFSGPDLRECVERLLPAAVRRP